MKSGLPLLIFLVFSDTKSVDSIDTFQTTVRNIKHDVTITHSRKVKYKEQDEISSLINVELDECVWKCHAKSKCVAAEYRRRAKICVLIRRKSGVEKQAGSIAIHGFAAKASRKCGETNCTARQTCQYSENGFTCVIEECSNPMIAKKLLGNIYSVGSKIIQTKCHGKNQSFTCSLTGQWWTLEEKQEDLTCQDRINSTAYAFTNKLGITLGCALEEQQWMVIQRRENGYVDFYRDWDEYKYGFGSVCGEYWMGLENIHAILTNSEKSFKLQITIKDWQSNKKYARYFPFEIDDEEDLYRLHTGSFKDSSNAGDSMTCHDGCPFSTFDRDHDAWNEGNLAESYHGAWWFNTTTCYTSHLNGRYYGHDEINPTGHGLMWRSWPNENYSLKVTVLRIKADG